jgi:uncharacterized membrane protein (UPF0127 family)
MFKNTRIYNVIFILVAVGALTLVVLFLRSRQAVPVQPIQGAVLSTDTVRIPVSIADTSASREQGLSNTLSLPEEKGMLFIFEHDDAYGFWMKDMRYPLDMVWIDSAMKIAGITANVSDKSYPQIFYAPQPVRYVLEVNAGYAAAHSLAVGQQFTLER